MLDSSLISTLPIIFEPSAMNTFFFIVGVILLYLRILPFVNPEHFPAATTSMSPSSSISAAST